MNALGPGALFQEAMRLLVSTTWPLFTALVVVGLVVGILQAATQINDSAVGFVPRLAAGVLVVWLLGGWMVERFGAFLARMIEAMSGAAG